MNGFVVLSRASGSFVSTQTFIYIRIRLLTPPHPIPRSLSAPHTPPHSTAGGERALDARTACVVTGHTWSVAARSEGPVTLPADTTQQRSRTGAHWRTLAHTHTPRPQSRAEQRSSRAHGDAMRCWLRPGSALVCIDVTGGDTEAGCGCGTVVLCPGQPAMHNITLARLRLPGWLPGWLAGGMGK